MSSLNFLMLPFLIAFVMGDVQAEAESAEIDSSITVAKTDLERLRSWVSQLELNLKDKINDLNVKRNLITQREKEIEEQWQTIISVQNMIEVLQKKESGNTITSLAKAYARIRELEAQVEGLKESIRKQKQEQSYFKLQVDKAVKKAKDQASKNKQIEYFVSEQWVSIQQTEQALQIAEAVMLKAQDEVTSKTDDLSKAFGGWLPPWVRINLLEFQVFYPAHVTFAKQTLGMSYWVEHAEFIVHILREKGSVLYLFPLFGIFMLFPFIFGMKKKFANPVQSSLSPNARRKLNRRHAKK